MQCWSVRVILEWMCYVRVDVVCNGRCAMSGMNQCLKKHERGTESDVFRD